MGGTPKFMFYHGKSQSKMDDDSGYPHDSGNLQDPFVRTKPQRGSSSPTRPSQRPSDRLPLWNPRTRRAAMSVFGGEHLHQNQPNCA